MSPFLSFHAVLLRMGMSAAQWILTAFRTTKALLLLPFSFIFSAGLPRPLLNLTTPPPPLGFIKQTDAPGVHGKYKHTLDRLKS